MRRFKEPAVISATRYAIAVLMLLTAAPATTYAAAADAATNYPTHPIRFILGYPPGGASDAVARQLAFSLGARMGQNIVLDNRGGAGGNIAAELAARAAPDGYTWFLGNNGILATNQALYEKLPFDPVKDFATVTLVGTQPSILVVNPAVAATSVRELIALAKAKPGQLNYASSGTHRRAIQISRANQLRAHPLSRRRSRRHRSRCRPGPVHVRHCGFGHSAR